MFYCVSARSFLVIYLIVGSFTVGADLPAVASYLSLKGKASARHLWWAVRSMHLSLLPLHAHGMNRKSRRCGALRDDRPFGAP